MSENKCVSNTLRERERKRETEIQREKDNPDGRQTFGSPLSWSYSSHSDYFLASWFRAEGFSGGDRSTQLPARP